MFTLPAKRPDPSDLTDHFQQVEAEITTARPTSDKHVFVCDDVDIAQSNDEERPAK